MHLAVTSPLDVPRLAEHLGLFAGDCDGCPPGLGGHPVTDLVLGLAPLVDRLDLVTLDPTVTRPIVLEGENTRLAVGPLRPHARTRALDLFAIERRFITRQLREWAPQIVSAHWTYEYALGALASGTPTLVTVHDWAPTILRYAIDRYRVMRLAMALWTFARGRGFAAVSPYIASRVERITRRAVPVIPNGIDPAWFAGAKNASSGAGVLAVNDGFGRRKNLSVLLESFPAVRAAHRESKLILVGQDFEENGPAARWATRRGLSEKVEFRGPVPRADLPELMACARVFVHPSLEESFGMVVLEAMATGLPVVGGKSSGGVPWLLERGAGLLVDVRDPAAIARAVSLLLTDEEIRSRVSATARLRAEARFGIAETVHAYLDQLGRIAADGS